MQITEATMRANWNKENSLFIIIEFKTKLLANDYQVDFLKTYMTK